MAVVYVCDACAQRIEGERNAVGIVVQRDYCDACAPIAREVVQALDLLHDQLALAWADGRERVLAAWREKFPDGKAPDDVG